MNTFETSATVEAGGRVLVAGVPFAPGTEVEVTVCEKSKSENQPQHMDDELIVSSRVRMTELFKSIRGFRNSPRFSREELYDRGRVH